MENRHPLPPHPEPRGVFCLLPGASFRTRSTEESDLKVGACPGAGRGDRAPGRSEPAGPELPGSLSQVLARPRVSERPGSVDRAVGGAGARQGPPPPASPPRNPGAPGAAPGPPVPSRRGPGGDRQCAHCPTGGRGRSLTVTHHTAGDPRSRPPAPRLAGIAT